MAGCAVDAEHRLRRIGIAAPDIGDVGQPQHPAADNEIDVAHILFGLERAGNAKLQGLGLGLDRAGRLHHVLRLQGGDQRRAVESEIGEVLGRELDEDALVLRAQDLDLGDVGDMQEFGADLLDIVAQFAMREAVRGEAVDDAERVAEIVVESGADDAGRKRVPDVADALADMIPDVRHLLRCGRAFQIDEDGGDAGAREAAQEVEMRRFLQLALEPLGDLLERLFDGGAGPGRRTPPWS